MASTNFIRPSTDLHALESTHVLKTAFLPQSTGVLGFIRIICKTKLRAAFNARK